MNIQIMITALIGSVIGILVTNLNQFFHKPFSGTSVAKANEEFAKIIGAYIAAEILPSNDEIKSLREQIAKKHTIHTQNLLDMTTIVNNAYCYYLASENIPPKQKYAINSLFDLHEHYFISIDDFIRPTLCQQIKQDFPSRRLFCKDIGLTFLLILICLTLAGIIPYILSSEYDAVVTIFIVIFSIVYSFISALVCITIASIFKTLLSR
jgi:hypothetical protein